MAINCLPICTRIRLDRGVVFGNAVWAAAGKGMTLLVSMPRECTSIRARKGAQLSALCVKTNNLLMWANRAMNVVLTILVRGEKR